MKFTSTAKVLLRSGKGGDGVVAWRRESRVVYGGPDGGNGGDGGSVYLEADENVNSLFHIRHIRVFRAKNGENGSNKNRHGRSAEDVVLKVPCGTNVFDEATGAKLFELVEHGERYLACRGGAGGRGNASFKSSQMPAPRLYELGDPAEERTVLLDLEYISDIGLLGKPNAGKSSLLSRISNAKPKIAPFPFTTLTPVLGTVEHSGRRLIFADIPGLIENASSGAGLGTEFLKHLNRCRVLLHLVDGGGEDILSDIEEIEREIGEYSRELSEKPRILVVNKLDLLDREKLAGIREILGKRSPFEVQYISSLTGENLDSFLSAVFDLYGSLRFPEPKKEDYLEFADDPDLFAAPEIERVDGVWNVRHPHLKYWVGKIPRDTLDNVFRLLQKVDSLGVNRSLERLGAKRGDGVNIYGWSYEYLNVG